MLKDLFLMASNCYTHRRKSLSPYTAEAMMRLKSNMIAPISQSVDCGTLKISPSKFKKLCGQNHSLPNSEFLRSRLMNSKELPSRLNL
jgi:hypothetical protein